MTDCFPLPSHFRTIRQTFSMKMKISIIRLPCIRIFCLAFVAAMHCANLDTLVKVTTANPLHQSPAHSASPPQLTQNMETREEESVRMLKMVLDAGILILEGRLPDRTSKRGCVEGPHCVHYPNKQQTHLCDFNNYLVRTQSPCIAFSIFYFFSTLHCSVHFSRETKKQP